MLTVALYGNSLVLAGIAARLARRTAMHPVTVDATCPDAVERLKELQPDVVVLDVGTDRPDPIVALWKAKPELLLIGVDLNSDRLLVLSGQPSRALTAEDLTEVLATCSDRKGKHLCTRSR